MSYDVGDEGFVDDDYGSAWKWFYKFVQSFWVGIMYMTFKLALKVMDLTQSVSLKIFRRRKVGQLWGKWLLWKKGGEI